MNASSDSAPPLIVHVIYRFNVGGLENGLVNLINHLPPQRYRHAVVCLTTSSEFAGRIRRADVSIYELHKREGKDLGVYVRLWRLLRRLRPTIVHSRNLATLESGVVAALAGVPIRIHGEHGRDIYDVDGKNRRYQCLRRLCAPFIHRFVPMSRDLGRWLEDEVKISPDKIVQLYNGVDAGRFEPRDEAEPDRTALPGDMGAAGNILIGTVGRLEPIKDQLTLVRAFLQLLTESSRRDQLWLVLFGDGSLRGEIQSLLREHQAEGKVWLAGSRDDVPALLPLLDIFVLPSLGEGISNTILEAMACGLPVVATRVGGNVELVEEGVSGRLVPAAQPAKMAEALAEYVNDAPLRRRHGRAGRERVVSTFSLEAMVQRYRRLYDGCLGEPGPRVPVHAEK